MRQENNDLQDCSIVLHGRSVVHQGLNCLPRVSPGPCGELEVRI